MSVAQPLSREIKTWMTLRVVFATLLLGLPMLLGLGPRIKATPMLYGIIMLTYLLTWVSWLVLRRMAVMGLRFYVIQLISDWGLETLLVAATGNVLSPFTFLYILTIFAGGMFLQWKGALGMASGATFSLGILAVFPYSNEIGKMALTGSAEEAMFMVILYAVSFFSIGVLSGGLSERLKHSESGLGALHTLYQNVVESIASGIITTDLSGRITSFNRHATAIIGVRRKKAVGTILWSLLDGGVLERRYHQLLTTGMPQRFEHQMATQQGNARQLGVTLSLLHDPQNVPLGAICIFQDLTQIKQLEEKIHQKAQMAAIGEMTASVAHEIRNPLAALSGAIQTLQGETALDGDNRRLLRIACAESDRLNTIITRFLQYARPQPLHLCPCDVQALLSDMVVLLNHRLSKNQQVQILQAVESAPMIIEADADQMRQLVWNLCMNALQAMPNGGILTLSTRLERCKLGEQGPRVKIIFQDTGSGIRSEDLPHLFEPFFTTKDSGSGLGLSIVSRIVEAHGGKIHVQSSPKGTAFIVDLPAAGPGVPSFNASVPESVEEVAWVPTAEFAWSP